MLTATVVVPVRFKDNPQYGPVDLDGEQVRVVSVGANAALVEHLGEQFSVPKAWLEMSNA